MAGRISNEAKAWIAPIQEECSQILADAGSKMSKVLGLALYQQQSQPQTLGSSETTLANPRSTRGGTRAQKAKAGRAGGKARARKLSHNSTGTDEIMHTGS